MKTPTLSVKVSLLLGTATVLLLGAAALLTDYLVDAQLQRRFDDELLTQARTLAASVVNGPQGLAHDVPLEWPARTATDIPQGSWAMHCVGHAQLHSQPPMPASPPDWQHDASPVPAYDDLQAGATALRAVWFRFVEPAADSNGVAPVHDCRVLFAQSRQSLDDVLLEIDIILLVIPLLALLLVLAVSPALVRRGLRPLDLLSQAMQDIEPHVPGQRLQAASAADLEPLVDGFNQVLVRVDEALARERRFADALAHEIRTRLTELRTLVDVERRFPDGRTSAQLFDEIGAIGTELEATVSALLLLTRFDAGQQQPDWCALDLQSAVNRQMARFASLAQKRAIQWRIQTSHSPISLRADTALFDIVLGNLLRNACEYAPEDSAVEVILDTARLQIANVAPDLDAEDVKRLGERFWSKQQGRGGHLGLGLALASAATATMGMQLSFALHAGQRLCVTLEWHSPSSA